MFLYEKNFTGAKSNYIVTPTVDTAKLYKSLFDKIDSCVRRVVIVHKLRSSTDLNVFATAV